MAKVHEKVVDDAVLIWVVHDTNPHALSPKVKSLHPGPALVPGPDDDRGLTSHVPPPSHGARLGVGGDPTQRLALTVTPLRLATSAPVRDDGGLSAPELLREIDHRRAHGVPVALGLEVALLVGAVLAGAQ